MFRLIASIKKLNPTLLERDFALLYSGVNRQGFSGRFSYLALAPKQQLKCQTLDELRTGMSETSLSSQYSTIMTSLDINNVWIGYFGYEMNSCNVKQKKTLVEMPQIAFTRFTIIYVLDHETDRFHFLHSADASFVDIDRMKLILKPEQQDQYKQKPIYASNLSSNMSRAEYLEKVEAIKYGIICGDLYQANLTRKFYGDVFGNYSDFLARFLHVAQSDPVPYSAFIKFGQKIIISLSPERYLKIDRGFIDSRPIKGSAPQAQRELLLSDKERAENLMIVDLVRNDLARSAIAGSVEVAQLFETNSYNTIHHLSSTITARQKPELDNLTTINNAFPAGSMTGAPKIAAMKLLANLEGVERGVYSGALGILSGNSYADLSVVIRTVLVDLAAKKFEFQLGGAITFDSVAEMELSETMTKALSIIKILNIDISELERQ